MTSIENQSAFYLMTFIKIQDSDKKSTAPEVFKEFSTLRGLEANGRAGSKKDLDYLENLSDENKKWLQDTCMTPYNANGKQLALNCIICDPDTKTEIGATGRISNENPWKELKGLHLLINIGENNVITQTMVNNKIIAIEKSTEKLKNKM